MLNDAGYIEKEDFKVLRQFGLGKIEMIKDYNGCVSFRTRSSKGGLGEGFDFLVIDEAQEYTIPRKCVEIIFICNYYIGN